MHLNTIHSDHLRRRALTMGKQIWIVAAMALFRVYGQTPDSALLNDAANALGGKARIQAIRTLTIEGSGTNPNAGQTQSRRSSAGLEGDRLSQDDRSRQRAHAYRAAPPGGVRLLHGERRSGIKSWTATSPTTSAPMKSTRASESVARDRRIEMLANPIAMVRAALDPAAKLSHVRKEGNLQLVNLTTAKGDHLTLAFDAAPPPPPPIYRHS